MKHILYDFSAHKLKSLGNKNITEIDENAETVQLSTLRTEKRAQYDLVLNFSYAAVLKQKSLYHHYILNIIFISTVGYLLLS